MPTPKVLAIAGSTRKDSYNKRLLAAAAVAVKAHGGEVTVVDLAEYVMPIYDGDLEARDGLPDAAKRLKAMFKSHQALLIASPEYNSSVSGVLKNAIDWVSRPEPGEASLAAFTGKVAGLMSAGPGELGGLRGLVHLRSILGNIQVMVVPEQVALPKAHEAFEADGRLKDAKRQGALESLVKRVVTVAGRINS